MKKTILVIMIGLLVLVSMVQASFECADGTTGDECDPIWVVAPAGQYIRIFEFTNSTILLNASVDLGAGYEVDGGIACYDEACYFKRRATASNNSRPMYLNMNTLALTVHPGVQGTGDLWGDYTPIFVPVTPSSCQYLGGGGGGQSQLEWDLGTTITLTIDTIDYEITLSDINYGAEEVDVDINGVPYDDLEEGECRLISGSNDLEICNVWVRETSAILGLGLTGTGGDAYTKNHLLVWAADQVGYAGDVPWGILQTLGLNFSSSSVDYNFLTFPTYPDDGTAKLKPSLFIPYEGNGQVGVISAVSPNFGRYPSIVGNDTLITYTINDFCLGVGVFGGDALVVKTIKNLGDSAAISCLSNAVNLQCGSEQASDVAFIYGDASGDMVAICLSKDGDVKFEMALPDISCSDIEKDIAVTEIYKDYYYDGITVGGGVISFRDVSSVDFSYSLRQINISGIVEPLLGLTIPVDINNDGVVDFITLNGTDSKYFVTSAIADEISTGPLSVKRLSPCNIDTTYKQYGIATVGIIGTVPEPWNLNSYYYEMNFGDGHDNVRQLPTEDEKAGIFTYLDYIEPGNHTVTGYICEYGEGTDPDVCVNSTCILSVESNITIVDPETIEPGECFTAKWIFDNAAISSFCANSYGYLDFSGYPSFAMAKKSVCDQRSFDWTPVIKLSADTKVDLSIRSGESPYTGDGGFVAQLKIEGNQFKVYKNNEWEILLGNVSLGEWHSVKISLDAQYRRVRYYLDNADEAFYEGPFPDVSVSNFYSLWKTVRYYSGNLLIDSMSAGCIQGRGGISIPLKNEIVEGFEECGMDISILSSCTPDNTLYSQAVTAGDPISSYENVYSFCSQKDVTLTKCSGDVDMDNRLCDYEDLKNIVNIRPACTAEAMNYCVDTLYTLRSGGAASDGVVVCSATLGFGVALDKVTVPIISYFYKIFIGNVTEILILIVGLIIIFTIIGLKKR